jgi:membrane-bound metal-dependent hydrolase YbcI (DUF457 family)
MDTITHAFAGALIGKGIFAKRRGSESSGASDEFSQPARVAIFAATLGAAFPDIDVFYDAIARDPLAMLKYHRYVTHSWLLLPVWAALLAWITRWIARRFKIQPPSFGWTWLCYAAGIASHILLDLATSWGTMCWSPLSRVRATWDLIFIVDFTMTALLLLPQVASWVLRDERVRLKRASRMWALFSAMAVVVYWFAASENANFSGSVVVVASVLIAALFFIPAISGRGANLRRSTWARAGLTAGVLYLLACFVAHAAAMNRVKSYAEEQKLNVRSVAALPMAPSIWRWENLILTDNAVIQMYEDLSHAPTRDVDVFGDTAPEKYLEKVRDLPEAQTYLWFARFPKYSVKQSGGETDLDITDMRFFSVRSGPSPGFTFRVVFDAAGNVVRQGMLRRDR